MKAVKHQANIKKETEQLNNSRRLHLGQKVALGDNPLYQQVVLVSIHHSKRMKTYDFEYAN